MIYSFSTFAFESGALELRREGRRVAIEPQPARALAVLVARAGEVVTREEMRQAIWGDQTHVDYDRGLAYCISQVRLALGDSAEQPRFVQTLPKRGFRFIAPVAAEAPRASAAAAPSGPPAQVQDPGEPAAKAPAISRRGWIAIGAAAALLAVMAAVAWQPATERPRAVVAVSIFDNETGNPALDAFVAGLSDVVVAELTPLAPGRIGVVGNAAPLRQPRNIRNLRALAAGVDADYVVLGQLQRQDDQLRFIVHFIRLTDGVHLSAQRFIRPATQVRGFEADVAAEARRAVQAFILASDAP